MRKKKTENKADVQPALEKRTAMDRVLLARHSDRP
jgi:hypothetical protein